MTHRDRLADLQAVAEVLDAHEQHRVEVEADSAWLERDPAELAALAEAGRLRALEETSPGFALARQVLNRGWHLVALDGSGRPRSDSPPPRDEEAAARFWSEYPAAQAGILCGTEESDLYALELGNPGGQGYGWLKAVAVEPPPLDFRPDPEEGWSPRNEGWVRDPLGSTVRLAEERPRDMVPRRRHFLQVPPMTERARREQALAVGRPLQPPQRLICVWEWPADGEWRLPKPGSRIADQVTVLGAIPSEGSLVEIVGRQWRALNGLQRLQAMPPWLCEAIGGRRVGDRGKTATWHEATTH